MIHVGDFCITNPSEQHSCRRIGIVLTGEAYGWGWELDTAGVLKALPSYVSDGTKFIDVGAGTGIIAIAAAKLGAVVTATEAFTATIAVTRANVERNGVVVDVQQRIDVPEGDYDVAAVNLGQRESLEIGRATGAAVVLVGNHITGEVDVVRR